MNYEIVQHTDQIYLQQNCTVHNMCCLILHKHFCLKHFFLPFNINELCLRRTKKCVSIYCYWLVFTKTEMSCQILVKWLNVKFHENLFRNSLVACIQMDKQAQWSYRIHLGYFSLHIPANIDCWFHSWKPEICCGNLKSHNLVLG